MYDTIIVGGGITGLYCAIHLSNVLLLEESNHWGGRIKTHYHPRYEIGSGRFHKNHKLLWNLIKRFKLTPQPIPITLDLETEPEGIISIEDYLSNMIRLWTRHDHLKHKLFYDKCVHVLGESDALHFMYAQGYHEMYFHNAYDSLHSFHMDYCQEDYYVLKEGLNELCLRMIKDIKGTCILNHSVKTISRVKEHLCVDGYEGKNIIITIPPSLFHLFPILSPYASLVPNLSGPPLLRIYVKYPSPVWFETIQFDEFKHLIPMNDGILMMVYIKKEDILKFTYKGEINVECALVIQIECELNELFPFLKIQNPLWIKPYLWKGGIHHWFPSHSADVHHFPKIENVFVCGEAFSTRQYWIEGALESASSILHTNINK